MNSYQRTKLRGYRDALHDMANELARMERVPLRASTWLETKIELCDKLLSDRRPPEKESDHG